MVLQIALHFFVSQSIFAMSITVRDIYRNPDTSTGVGSAYLANCGYSPTAIWAAFGGGVVILLSAYAIGLRRFKEGGPPIVGTCSAAISAGCHPRACVPGQGEQLCYGECRRAACGGMGIGEVGHCSIEEEAAWNKGIVGRAVEGRFYAGKRNYEIHICILSTYLMIERNVRSSISCWSHPEVKSRGRKSEPNGYTSARTLEHLARLEILRNMARRVSRPWTGT